MWWILLIGVLGTVIYSIYISVVETQCPYCQKRFGKRLIESESKNSTVAHFLLDIREEKNSYVCTSCGEDWWIDGERTSRHRIVLYNILGYLDADDPGEAFAKHQYYLLRSFVRSFGRTETLVGIVAGATAVLLMSLNQRLAPSLFFMVLVIVASFSGVGFWVIKRLDFLPPTAYTVIARVIIGGISGGLIVFLLLSLFKLISE